MTNRIKDLLILGLLGAAVAAFIAVLVVRGGLGGPSALAAVPEDSFLVASVDVRAVGESPLAEVLVGKDPKSTKLPGVDTIAESCGFNPLFRMRDIVLAVPEGGEHGDFGLAATGDMTKDELTACAQKLIAKRGGVAKVGTIGTFTVVEDDQLAASDAAPKVAFRDGGPYLVGRGAWLARMIDTVEGRVPSIAKSEVHAAIRRSLEARDPSARALVVSAALPKSLRDRLRGEMAGEARDGNAMMAGVLGVASAGLALRAGRAGGDTAIYAELRCETDAACIEVKKLIEKQRFAWSRDFGIRLVGLGPLVDHLEVETQGTTLRAKTSAPSDDVARALDRALGSRASPRPPTSARAAAPPTSSPLAPSPDEILTPKPIDAGHAAPPARPADAATPR